MSKLSTTTRQIDALLQKAIDEALEDGVDIKSEEFQESLEKLKSQLVEAHGISLDDYESTKKASGTFEKLEKAIDDFSSQVEKLETETDEKVKATEQKAFSSIDELKQLISETQHLLTERLEEKVSEKADKKDLFRKDEEIKEIASQIESEREKTKRELYDLGDTIKKKLGKKVAKEIKVKKEFSKEEKRKLKELMSKDWFNEIQEQIHDLTPRLWQGMAMGLKKSISNNSVDKIVFNETLSGTVDGSNKDFTLSKTPVSGSLVLKDENGVVLDEDAGDYSISGKTATLEYAPLSKAPTAIIYRK